MPTTKLKEELLSTADVAKWLGVSETQVRALEQRGDLPAVRFGKTGRTIRYRREDLQTFLDDHYVEA